MALRHHAFCRLLRDKEAANLARERHEFHQLRLERDKQEKAEKLAQKEKAALAAKAAAPATPPASAVAEPAATEPASSSTAQDLINAAIARAREQAAAVKAKNVETLTPQQQAEIAEIEARRAKVREMSHPDADLLKE